MALDAVTDTHTQLSPEQAEIQGLTCPDKQLGAERLPWEQKRASSDVWSHRCDMEADAKRLYLFVPRLT